MKVSVEKKYEEPYEIRLYWLGLLAFGGALMLFVVAVCMKGFPTGRESWMNVWPFIAGFGVLLFGRLLFRHYKDHKAARRDFRLGLGDMIVAFGLLGAAFTVLQWADSERFLAVGVPLGVLLLACVLAGFMRARARGLTRSPARQLYAVGHAFRSIGIFGLGALAMIFFLSIFAQIDPIDLATSIFIRRSQDGIIGFLPHIAVAAFIVGVTLCSVAKRESVEPTPEAMDASD